ncbi:MAG: cadherin-like domain-containing protein [Alphaproteobacteria bacterium]|nr:cadherin-like domain-containing protein [Alphaproteobacteria bacterium]MDD9919952.1 cadherin-like domain-containing protein [Alphaproteobacteria bacterium]
MRGGDGDDSLFGQNDVDQLYGGAGNDIIDGGKDADIAFGGIGDDLLYGNFANDALYGEIGSDLLIGGGGRDTLDGGAGNDVYLYNRKDGIDTITDTDGVNTLKFEDLNAADIASINQVGNDLVLTIDSLNSITVTDQFTTLGLADIEFADGQRIEISNMTFDGAGVGSYTLVAGTNILSTVANQYGYYNQITMPFNAGTALSTDWLLNNYDTNVTTDAYEAEIYNDVQVRTWTKTAGFFGMRFSMGYYDYHERFLEGSGSADRVVGLWWDENIEGFSNNDQLYGNNGNDTILGGIDHDLIYGGSGDDTLNGEIGADQIFGGTGNDIIYGGDGNDTFYGEWGNDNLNGDGGDDYLSGGTGTDTLNGGTGRDLLYGDEGDDNLFGGLEDDFLSGGSGTDTLRGEAGRDLLFGGEGDDDLQGGDGDDTLIGVEGNDALDGGDGTDMAVFGGKLADYNVTVDVNGTATVTDLRANSLDGADTLSNVETLQFFDQMVDLTSQAVQIRDIILPQNTTFNGQVVIPSGYTLSLEQGTDRGVVTLDADGSYSYTSSEFAGQTSFQYKLIDAQGITTVSKVNVFVAPSAADMNAYAHGTEENVSTGTFVDASSMDYRSQTTALSNGGHVVVWRAKSETNTSELNLYYRVYNAAGVATTASLLAPAVEAGIESYGHVSALNDGGFLLSWYENDGKAKWRSFDADGNATTGDISFIDPALSQGNHTATGAHIVELNSGNLGGVWVADNQLYFGEFNTAGNRVGTATVITSVDVEAARYLDVTKLTSGSLAITWQKELASHPHDADVRTAIVSESGVLIGNIQDVYADVDGGSFSDPRYQQTPHVAALNDGGYVVVFTSSHTYSENNVYFMRYDVSGDAVTASPVLVNDASISGEQFANGVTALADGGFMVMWDINGSYQLYARRYDAAGNSVGNEFKIHDTAINNQPWSDITSLSNGDLIATWTRNDAGNFEIVQKRFIPNDTYLSILGDSGAEDIVADNSADVITASDGDDTIVGGSGDDVIDGGAGTDTAYFDSRLSDYTISIADETVTVTDNRGATSSASTIFSRENFEETVTGWSDNMTTDGGASFTNFLGRFGSGQLIEKTFNVSSYADEVVVSFDFYQIDSWDWDERFQVLVDDTLIFSEQFLAGDDEAAQSGQAGNVSWSIEPLTPPGQLGFQSGSGEYWWQDQKHQITLTIENPNESFKLGLTSTLNQAIGDESFGIDNVTMDAKRYGNIIASEDFEGVVTGWSDNTTTDGGTGLSTFLGRFASGAITEKTFEISPNAAEVVVSFDFYQIDSWDWPEEFQVLVDDVLILSENFLASENEAGRSGQTGDVSWSIDPLSDPEHLGFKYGSGESWNQDQKHRVTLVIANPSSSFKLGFTSTLDQNIYDESFGIDNLQITAHIPDGTDTLSNVENLAFTDQTIQWAGLFNDLNDIVIGQGTAYNGQIELQVGDVAGLAQAATHGTVTVNTNGTYSYTAPASYLGDDSFVYSVTTSTGIQRTVTVNITVANNLSGTDAGEILVSSSGNDILNGTDGTDTAAFSGDFADYSLLFNGDILTVTDNRTGSPDGTDTLLNIENAQFADQTVSVSNLFSDMPNFITPQGETLMGQIDLPAGHTLSLVSAPSQGTLVLNADGSYQYDAPANFAGTLSFTYQMTTPNGIVKQQTSDIDVLALTSSAAAYTHGTEENVSTGTFVDASSMDYRSQTTALSNGGHVVVWRARNEINTNELNFYYRVYNAAGVATTAALLAPAVEAGIESYGHVSALNDGGFLLSWYENDGKAKWRGFDADGNATTGDISFIDPALSQGNHTATGAHIIELHSGNLGGVWVADNQLYFGEFDTAGNRVGAATVITSVDVEAARDLDVTKLTDGSLAVTWQKELYALPYDSDVRTAVISDTGALIGSVQDVYPDADGGSISAPRYQQMSYVAALNNGSYVVAFTSSHTYSENNIYFMRYDSSGNALTTSPVLVNDASISGQQFANGITALADGGFMVTWDVDGAFGLYGRRYDSVGNSVGNEFQIHDTAINNQPWSDITSLSNGDLIATWTRNDAGNFEVVQKKLIAPPPEGVAVTGDSSDEVLLGSAADDVLNGGVGNDTLQGQAGDDTLSGGLGDDIYLFGTGDGSDTVSNQDFAGTDIVKFGTGIERQDIWFEQDGLDLRALLHESDDQIIFENWFSSDEQKVDQFQLEDGYQLNTAQVSELVETMSNYDPIALGTISTIADLPDEVENIVISSWVM